MGRWWRLWPHWRSAQE